MIVYDDDQIRLEFDITTAVDDVFRYISGGNTISPLVHNKLYGLPILPSSASNVLS